MQKEQPMNRIVNGYCFMSEEDASLARQEKEKAAYLERHMDYSNPYNVMAIYHKAIESRTFRTPVGMDYLKKLQNYLEKTRLADEIQAIPDYQRYVLPKEKEAVEARRRVKSDPYKGMRRRYRNLILVNVVLAAVIVAMFVITMQGENANIINYRNVITNEYSEWEQELTDRENAVRERERELQISNN